MSRARSRTQPAPRAAAGCSALIVAQIGLTQPLLLGIAMVIWIVRLDVGRDNRASPLAERVTMAFGIRGGAGTP